MHAARATFLGAPVLLCVAGCASLSGLTGGEADASADHKTGDAGVHPHADAAAGTDAHAADAHDASAHDASTHDSSPAKDAGLGRYAAAVLGDSPLAYYPMDETSGTVMHDLGPLHLNGTYGTGVTLGAAGLVPSSSAHAPQFPGATPATTNIASVPPASPLEPVNALSVELFVEEDIVNPTQSAIDLVSEGPVASQPFSVQLSLNNTFQLYLPTVSPGVQFPGADFIGPTVLVPGKVYQVVVTYDGSTASLYVNGALNASAAATGTLNYAALEGFGLGVGGGFDEPFRVALTGRLGQVSVYGAALTASEVAAHWAAAGGADGGA